jgi:hypothetical protein
MENVALTGMPRSLMLACQPRLASSDFSIITRGSRACLLRSQTAYGPLSPTHPNRFSATFTHTACSVLPHLTPCPSGCNFFSFTFYRPFKPPSHPATTSLAASSAHQPQKSGLQLRPHLLQQFNELAEPTSKPREKRDQPKA